KKTSKQINRKDIINGKILIIKSMPSLCFLFFSHTHLLKTILSLPASGTFGMPLPTKTTLRKAKRATSLPTHR
ncbi:MAG: hypothetical protein ACK57X_14605, partial [Bacteroidota bacterium]